LVGELARRSCIRRASATTLRALSTVHAEKLWEAIVSAANEVSLADFDDNGEWADGIPAGYRLTDVSPGADVMTVAISMD
jgi:hypothetical protein